MTAAEASEIIAAAQRTGCAIAGTPVVTQEADRTEAILLSAREQRDGVLAALSRIDEASYGQCVDCGHEIPEGRLDAQSLDYLRSVHKV